MPPDNRAMETQTQRESQGRAWKEIALRTKRETERGGRGLSVVQSPDPRPNLATGGRPQGALSAVGCWTWDAVTLMDWKWAQKRGLLGRGGGPRLLRGFSGGSRRQQQRLKLGPKSRSGRVSLRFWDTLMGETALLLFIFFGIFIYNYSYIYFILKTKLFTCNITFININYY